MFPILFSIGGINIYSFGLFTLIGIIFALYYVWKNGRGTALSEEKIIDAALVTILGGIIGARLLYVFSNFSNYSYDLAQILAIYKGGLSFWGAVLGGFVTLIFVSRRLRFPFLSLLDLATPALAIGATFGYIGAFLAGSSYGAATNFFWGVPQIGLSGKHNPSQLLEAAFQLVIFILIIRFKKRAPFSGFIVLCYLVIYSIGRFFLEFLRGDQTIVWGFLSQAQIFSLVIGLFSLGLLYLRVARSQGTWAVNPRNVLRRQVWK